jgi:hypothetical protein
VITYRTFSDYKFFGWSPAGILRRWEQVRRRAREFVNQLDEQDIVAITESSFGNSPYAITVTVWYRQR